MPTGQSVHGLAALVATSDAAAEKEPAAHATHAEPLLYKPAPHTALSAVSVRPVTVCPPHDSGFCPVAVDQHARPPAASGHAAASVLIGS